MNLLVEVLELMWFERTDGVKNHNENFRDKSS